MDWELLAEQMDWRRKYERENGAPDPLEVETELLRMERESSGAVSGGDVSATTSTEKIPVEGCPTGAPTAPERPLTKFEEQFAKALLAWGRRL